MWCSTNWGTNHVTLPICKPWQHLTLSKILLSPTFQSAASPRRPSILSCGFAHRGAHGAHLRNGNPTLLSVPTSRTDCYPSRCRSWFQNYACNLPSQTVTREGSWHRITHSRVSIGHAENTEYVLVKWMKEGSKEWTCLHLCWVFSSCLLSK